MKPVIWKCDPEKRIGKIEKNLYGGFVEHLGRNVYGGIYDPESVFSDEDGFRTDVLSLIRELDMPITRYPGGSCTDLFCWEDGIGPRTERRAKMDLAWHQLEPNTFGLDEFMKWARKADTEPLITVNIANRSLMDTAALYEYCNLKGGTYWSDKRRANGIEKPYGVRKWCLGNELYGEWEFGQKNAEDYGKLAREHAKVLRQYDPECFLILCGKCYDMKWNRTVLELCGDVADCISLHDVFCPTRKSEQEYLRGPDQFERAIEETEKVCQAVHLMHPACREISISADEWILWDYDRRMRPEEEWTTGMHLLEQNYTIREALIAGEILSVFHRHADSVKIACIAQSVNVLAPIRTEAGGGCWKQSIFYPFALTSRYGRGDSLRLEETGNESGAVFGSAVWNTEKELAVFAVNRAETAVPLEIQCNSIGGFSEALTLTQPDHDAVNSPKKEWFVPGPLANLNVSSGSAKAELPPFSWNMIRLKQK